MRVVVFNPQTDGERVTFRWWQSEPNPFQNQNEFFLSYDGIDTADFSTELWLEIFFALISRVLFAYDKPVRVEMPMPISQRSVDYWLARHSGSGLVTVSPTHSGGYSPWRDQPNLIDRKRIGILFGGGKDSLAGLALAHECYGPDPLLMVHWFAGFSPGPKQTELVRTRAERLMLEPVAAKTGIQVQRAETDYRANLIGRSKSPVKPHLELLVTASLPIVLARGLETMVITENTWTMSHFRRMEDGSLRPLGLNLRPESFRLESLHYRQTVGTELGITYPSRGLSASQNIGILLRRYPHLAPHLSTCLRMTSLEQFCYDCYKCSVVAPISLAEGHAVDWYDYDAMFSNDAYWERFLGEAPAARPRNEFGNPVWTPGFVSRAIYAQICDAFHRLDIDLIRDRLSPPALRRLEQLKQLYGNAAFPYLQSVPAAMTAYNGDTITADIMEVIAREYPLTDQLPEPYLSGFDDAVYDFSIAARPYTAGLPHLQPNKP